MQITDTQVRHFHDRGFILLPNPLDEQRIRNLRRLVEDRESDWGDAQWPQGMNRYKCQFLSLGDPALELLEGEMFVEAARRLLGRADVYIGACGFGDASIVNFYEGRPQNQLFWHSDARPFDQVSFRFVLDRLDESNAPLRVLPGSHRRPADEVQEELLQLEMATGRHDEVPSRKQVFVRHPDEVELILDPRWILVWTPTCWHATGVKSSPGPRRSFSWNYYAEPNSDDEVAAVRHVLADQWSGWADERKRLWSLSD